MSALLPRHPAPLLHLLSLLLHLLLLRICCRCCACVAAVVAPAVGPDRARAGLQKFAPGRASFQKTKFWPRPWGWPPISISGGDGGSAMKREEDVQLKAAKRGFREAEADGNHEEEARWANVIGDILKRRGEYVEALRWLRRDYEVSTKHLPQKQLLPTCQSLGEVHFRLERFKEALTYQSPSLEHTEIPVFENDILDDPFGTLFKLIPFKKHLQLAKESEDLIEQQRASTQLGRTYHEIFLKSEDDHGALRNAKKYFKAAMKLARILKEKQSYYKSSLFLKEFIDAYNNVGMLEKDLDNLEEARKILHQGLKICDDEEIDENDDARTRLHHNLGGVYLELRQWGKAKEHIERDITICRNIDHPEGEAKGFINLGELHYRMQNYEDAIHCYRKALKIASSMQDEDALVHQINQNIDTAKEAKQVREQLQKEEQKLRKLTRATSDARGTGNERKCLLEQYALLDCLIDKSNSISAWSKLQEFAKRKKKVANELCDKEKLTDSYLATGESYQKLRNFGKARKWYLKGWNTSRLIGNLEGQALAKINIGNVLDSAGDWAGALESFEEGYRIATEGNVPSAQLSALENMHYSHMIRFDNVEQARKLHDDIQKLRRIVGDQNELKNYISEYCSETETEGEEMSGGAVEACGSQDKGETDTVKLSADNLEEYGDDIPLDTSHPSVSKDVGSACTPINHEESTCSFKSRSPKLSYENEMECGSLSAAGDMYSAKGPASGTKADHHHTPGSLFPRDNDTNVHLSHNDDMHALDIRLINLVIVKKEVYIEVVCCKKFLRLQYDVQSLGDIQHVVTFKVGGCFINVDMRSCMNGDKLSEAYVKAAVACHYYLQLPEEKRSKGLLPIIRSLTYYGKDQDILESIDEIKGCVSARDQDEAVIQGWFPKHLMKLYIDSCKKLSEEPIMKLLIKLYNPEVSEDEVIVSDCGLQDVSISPFLDALQEHKTLSVLDVSHNLLGNKTMEKLHQIFTQSGQTYGGLTVDLHCNQFGPTALFQDGMTQLTDALSKGPGELVNFDVSYCGLVSQDIMILRASTFIVGVTELNLGGNSVGREGCDALASLLADPRCCLQVLNLSKCHLGLAGLLHMLKTLSENESLEELYLADNADINSEATLLHDSTAHDAPTSPCRKLNPVAASTDEGLQVADSEDDEHPKRPAVSGQDGSCSSSSRRHPVSQVTEELSTAIACAVQLHVLDLSRNGFTKETVEALYSMWRGTPSGLRRGGPARKHVKDQTVHFTVEGRRCCDVKPCCRRGR
ncbi:hypothetical protein Taro_038676 [Colocasia esculenta]|uniref:Protein TONSOKU n=1 Tax=Colocasia esculenta TaxID=4460 RepID=A0A843WTD2_COLES|nr:hypothetical protein [Colocasia esculenta]